MTKTKQDNDVIDLIGLVYTKKNIELSRPIWLAVVYEENQTIQWCDQLYMCHLHRNRNWTIGTYEPGAYVTKTKKDNDLTDRKSVVYTKKEIKLSWPIGLSAACDDN